MSNVPLSVESEVISSSFGGVMKVVIFNATSQSLVDFTGDIVYIDTEGDHIYLREKLLKHLFDINLHTPAPLLYIALSKTKPLDAHNGSTLIEPTDSAYSRLAIEYDDWYINEDGEAFNTVDLTFPTATEDWDEYPYVILLDAATNGNIYKYAKLETPAAPTNGNAFTIDKDTHWLFRYPVNCDASIAIRRVLQHFVLETLPAGKIGGLSLTLSDEPIPYTKSSLSIKEPVYADASTPKSRPVIMLGTNAWEYNNGTISNKNPIVFPTTNNEYNNIEHWALTTYLYGGYITFYGKLNAKRSLGPSTTITISAGEIKARLK